MMYCDRSDQIVSWASEEMHVPYVDPDGKHRNYYPDFMIEICDGRKVMVEIKPESQWKWKLNKAKWEAAKMVCDDYGWDFIVLGKKALYGR